MKLWSIFLATIFLLLAICPATAQNVPPRGGHRGKINQAVISADHRWLVSASEDETVKVWDLATGRETLSIRSEKEDESYEKLAVSPDGKMIAGSRFDKVSLWDLKTGAKLKDLDAMSATSLAFSPDGKQLAIAGDDFASVVSLGDEKFLELDEGFGKIAFHPKGDFLLTEGPGHTIIVWNPKTGAKIRTLKNTAPIESIVLNPAGTAIAVISRSEDRDYYVELWSATSGLKVKTFPKTKTGGLAAFMPDGKSLLVNDPNGLASVDFSIPENFSLLNSLNGQKQSDLVIDSKARGEVAAFSPDRQLMAVVDTSERNVYVFDLLKKKEIRLLKGHTIKATSIVFPADEKTLLAGYDDGTVIWWDLTAGTIKKLVSPEKKEGENTTAFDQAIASPDGSSFMTANRGVKFYSTVDGRALTGEPFAYFITRAALSPDGKIVAVVSDETITLREVPGGKILNRFVHRFAPAAFEPSVAFSPDGKTLITAVGTEIALWNPEKGAITKTFKGTPLTSAVVALSPDNKFLVVAPDSFSWKLKVFETESESLAYELKELEDGQEPRFSISPDGKILATVSAYNELLQLRELATGKLLRASKTGYDADDHPVLTAFSRNGSLVAVGGVNGIKVFKTATAEELFDLK